MVRPPNQPIEPMSSADIERFLGFVDRRGDDECWPWLGGCNEDDRGQFCLRGETRIAPRIAYYLATGIDPGDRMVCHTRNCNNPRCCNHRHLYLGTAKDNTRDQIACGHFVSGERNGRAKLTDELVAEIRRRYETEGISQRALARQYDVCQYTINKVVNCKSYISAMSSADASVMTILTPGSVTAGVGGRYSVSLADGVIMSVARYPDWAQSADLPNEPQAKADKRQRSLDSQNQEERRAECRYQVAG